MRLPTRKVAAAFKPILFAGDNGCIGNGMNRQIQRAAGGKGAKALRGAETADGNQRRQLVLAVKRIPAGFALRIGVTALNDI